MNRLILVTLVSCAISGCSNTQKFFGKRDNELESAKVNKNPPLIQPPNYNLIPPQDNDKKEKHGNSK